MAEQKKETVPKAPRKKQTYGAWMVLDAAGVVQMAENSQLRAALAALLIKGSIEFWAYGKTVAERNAVQS